MLGVSYGEKVPLGHAHARSALNGEGAWTASEDEDFPDLTKGVPPRSNIALVYFREVR